MSKKVDTKFQGLPKRFSSPGVSGYLKYQGFSAPKYDDIVDKSKFRPDSETTRSARLNPSEASMSGQGSYDYPDGKITEDRTPSDLILGLRTNKFDKAEVQEITQAMNEKAKSEIKDAQDKKALDKVRKTTEARQAHLDKATGFDASSVE